MQTKKMAFYERNSKKMFKFAKERKRSLLCTFINYLFKLKTEYDSITSNL